MVRAALPPGSQGMGMPAHGYHDADVRTTNTHQLLAYELARALGCHRELYTCHRSEHANQHELHNASRACSETVPGIHQPRAKRNGEENVDRATTTSTHNGTTTTTHNCNTTTRVVADNNTGPRTHTNAYTTDRHGMGKPVANGVTRNTRAKSGGGVTHTQHIDNTTQTSEGGGRTGTTRHANTRARQRKALPCESCAGEIERQEKTSC